MILYSKRHVSVQFFYILTLQGNNHFQTAFTSLNNMSNVSVAVG